jgi:hypothetical protein
MGIDGENKADGAKSAPMQRLIAALGANPGNIPPVERWNPPWCGEIDMRIAADGRWLYMGTPITRAPLVKLFASVLKMEEGRHLLVTPVEKLGIQVEDAPFSAVEMVVEGEGEGRQVSFRTNVDDVVSVDADHVFRFDIGADGGVKPYVHVRRQLWARLTRTLAHELLALGEVQDVAGVAMFGVQAGGMFHAALTADALGEAS